MDPFDGAFSQNDTPPPFHGVEEILSHPRFEEAMLAFVDGMVTLWSSDIRWRGLIEYRRAVCLMLIVCLYETGRVEDADALPRLSDLKELLPQLSIEGDRSMLEFVKQLEDAGLVNLVPAPHDRRERLIEPTEKLLALDREFLKVLEAPLALMFTDRDYSRALDDDYAYQVAYRRASMHTLAMADNIMVTNPPADYFIRENVGTRILMLLISEIRATPDRSTAPGFLTRAAERAAVSRTHVRNVIAGASEKGFVTISNDRARTITASPDLITSVERWVAECLAGTDLVHMLALEVL